MIQKTLPVVLLGMIGLLVVRPACADQIYEINVNTTALQSTTGYLDFQFNPGSPTPSDAASASLFDFTSDGSLTAPAGDIGDVTGAFPGIVIINNTDVANDHAEGFVYGSFFDVFVDLDVPIFSGNAASGSSFLWLVREIYGWSLGSGDLFGQVAAEFTAGGLEGFLLFL